MGDVLKAKELHLQGLATLGSLQIIFGASSNNKKAVKLQKILRQFVSELELPLNPERIYFAGVAPDTIDLLNEGCEFAYKAEITNVVLSAFADSQPDDFKLQHAKQLVEFPQLMRSYLNLLKSSSKQTGLNRIHPIWSSVDETTSEILTIKDVESLAPYIDMQDPFAGGRALRYENEEFAPIELLNSRTLDEFYGYDSVRRIFAEQFANFADERPIAPLFITSLPGLGKTAMTISYVLADKNLTLILPSPDGLQRNLPSLMEKLRGYPQHKFVLFFDDIDPREINWYFVRTHVGGSFAMPKNVTLVVAANYDFPRNVLSRGRTVNFPIFDELRCMEMIEDYLIQHKLRNPSHNLIAVIAADYVEEFGQKKFTELSPRSLIRYLEFYISDSEKRRRMLDSSRQEMIVRPDAQIFYEENIKLMRSLYGDGYIEELLQEKLRKLSQS